MWQVSRVFPAIKVGIPWAGAIAAGCAVAGVLVAVAGVVAFRKARTTVNPTTPQASSTIVSSGVYRWSRNPMYLGMAMALVGWAMYLSNVVAFLLVPAFMLYMNRFQIQPEERALEAKFGDPYRDYLRRVRRWI
jgi:protein-S-isoprenylcysteine O-methyltransferase Ste14